MVEFALVVPLLLLLLLTALDFGRVYLGWINLQNMARIAANYAANHPDAWGATYSGSKQARYRNQVLADAAATNCTLPRVGGLPFVAPPVFSDGDGDGDSQDLGDRVSVQLTCQFPVITPGIASILGGSVSVSADAAFPVKTGMSNVAAGGAVIGTPPNAAFSANGTISPNSVRVVGPTVAVEFRDTSGGAPTAWHWDFADGTTSGQQDPLQHTFTCAVSSCSFIVTLTASNLHGSTTATMTVVVVDSDRVNFAADRQSGSAPLQVAFSDASVPGGTNWSWAFGDGTTGTGQTVTHRYASPGQYAVSLTVTYPDGPVTLTRQAFIAVDEGVCVVPKLVGKRYNDAPASWSGAGFTGSVTRGPGAPAGNFTITAQSLVSTETAPCSSGIAVTAP